MYNPPGAPPPSAKLPSEDLPVCVLVSCGSLIGLHCDGPLCWCLASGERAVNRNQHDCDVVGEAQMRMGTALCASFLLMWTQSRVLFPMLVELEQSVCQVYMV